MFLKNQKLEIRALFVKKQFIPQDVVKHAIPAVGAYVYNGIVYGKQKKDKEFKTVR